MTKITVGFLARLVKEEAKDIDLLVYSYYAGRPSPSVTIEDGVYRGLTGGHIDSFEQMFQIAVRQYPGYVVQKRVTIEIETLTAGATDMPVGAAKNETHVVMPISEPAALLDDGAVDIE